MYRTLALAAAVAALAVPAFAKDITISLAGKSMAQIQSEIHSAAGSVCWANGYKPLDEQHMCTVEVEEQAHADLAALHKG